MWTDADLEHVAARLDTLQAEETTALTRALIPALLDRCAQDGWFWLRFVQTRDEADPDRSIKPFPTRLGYLHELWGVLNQQQRVVIAKSRQMLVSWAVAAYCVWTARFHPNQAIYWQSQQHKDAVSMVALPAGGYLGRCQFIEETLPAWMKMAYKPSEGLLQYPNGSMIQAVAGGADKVRGQVFSIYVGDEFARQEEQAGVYSTVGPLMQKGAKAFFISTPNGADNTFATLYHGRSVGIERT